MKWVNFLHIYQPPYQRRDIIERVVTESYQPVVEFLRSHPEVKVTINIPGILVEQLIDSGHDILLHDIGALAHSGQVELVGTSYAHAILPLIAAPYVVRQLRKHEATCIKIFGSAYHPRGFFPPEMCYSPETESVIHNSGFHWMIIDEIAYNGNLGKVAFNRQYRTENGMTVVFRNRHLSNYLSFVAQEASPDAFWNEVKRDDRSSSYLITAMDGENLGHHRKELLPLWKQLVTDQRVQTCTVSEYLEALNETEVCQPLPSSWSSEENEIERGISYGLWKHPDNALHTLQWQLVERVAELIERSQAQGTTRVREAESLFDTAIASDQFWWASAHPWWDIDMVISRAELLKKVGALLVLPDDLQNSVNLLVDAIRTTAHAWHREGVARRMRDTFMQAMPLAPWMANKKI
ncbi:MAG: hypothetical protein A2898_05370 [Candidatus Kerfeldbacteria bacterium RIFCSPLOWO2_01_FULL_48_11]|uniref:Glycoside hydrolase family 57 N-terminal domain-containing protein n=1 Tax=Candidatus Kerfeldbacteria bacterium RIFCSPLOWO2_01_FULL_48_11 TaxID=1798543 RepID=A0A1G2AZU8_9BACT|nr:MAG: hypothetical protein UY34_C0003G0018 [Parcubacteria group bacterium GW2011_GWA2_48_9]KKW16705.1 MAG: hypothetical protein UY52_C0001G0025 [Parcubacteria group bacterium GW2011_GWC2_49_9]OGY82434.1 MAG: hypothetical protein A2898_05370 [Candidatus Kerfeldbacteria bacterium RIFCSPLOWO2_01_FULL_48_11]HCJ52312.1 hypothetical protein [Candidatus Kerfeldbacteria bacterium]HCM67530.1 hypothetical protein [Candidatus Kerfeldbacteria bacterium]